MFIQSNGVPHINFSPGQVPKASLHPDGDGEGSHGELPSHRSTCRDGAAGAAWVPHGDFIEVKQCHKPPMTGNGLNPIHTNGDDWGMDLMDYYYFTNITEFIWALGNSFRFMNVYDTFVWTSCEFTLGDVW